MKFELLKEFWIDNKIKMNIESFEDGYEIKIEEKILPTYISYHKSLKTLDINKVVIKFDAELLGDIKSELFVLGYKDNNKVLTEVLDIKYSKLIDVSNLDELRFMLRVQGSGTINVRRISIESNNEEENFKSKDTDSKYLVLTNVYPSHTDLYRNGFVHRRVKLYQEKGLDIDVFSLKGKGSVCKYEFDDVNVYEGNKKALTEFLRGSNYKKILIHFIDQNMYEAIQQTVPNTKLIIWIHGVETEKWYRRMFNITNEKQCEAAIAKIEENYKRLRFMNEIYSREDSNIKFVFVSKWFKEEIAEVDAKAKVKESNYEIIHNIVDTDMFNYVPKSEEQRYKILTIRPFASRKYANDLSVKAILELSKQEYFNKLQIEIYGEGILFDEIVAPLYKFDNVKINKRFLKQDEIAKLHKEYGIFLCPTRLDSQGVSMCEAMSSGLVPVTTGVTAIPEFVKSDCGMLSDGESYMGLAKSIDYLINNPEKFKELSQNASNRMKSICSKEIVISKEIEIITQ